MFNQAAPGVTATNHSGLTDTNATIELNFRQAPLEQVLNYLSEAAGFVVALETSISRNATVDLWSQQKVSPKDAVRALDASLKRNGYSAIEDNNVLTIVSSGNRTSVGIPVITINSTNEVPISERLVTAVVPIRFIGAQEVMQIVYPLVPTTALISPSVSGNSLVITDTLSTVHRAVNVIRALDNPVATGTKTEVVFLNYMDAQTMAAIIQTLYQNQGGRGFGGGNNNALQQLLNLRGGGFGGGGFGGGGFGGGGGGGGGRGGGRGGRGGGGGFGF
jgi:type II secretory pathway component GspD/PulD (secretin)